MATRHLTRSFHTTKQFLSTSLTSRSLSNRPFSSSSLFRLRPLGAISARFHQLSPSATAIRHSSTCQTPNWSNRPPGETILLDGCDFKHWLVVMEKPEQEERDKIIDSYIKTLATVVGSEEEARKKIYSVSTRHYYGFGALVSEELSYKIKAMPGVRWVFPDCYLDVKKKDYGGEPFINGQAVPYDPKYHEEWLRNNTAVLNQRTPGRFDRSRLTERRQNVNKQDSQTPMANPSRQNPRPNMAEVQPLNAKGERPMDNPIKQNPRPNMVEVQPLNAKGERPMANPIKQNPRPNMAEMQPLNAKGERPLANPSRQNPRPNMAEVQPSNANGAFDMQMPSSKTGSWSNMGGMQANSMEAAPNVGRIKSDNMGRAPNTGGMQANSTTAAPNTGGIQSDNMGETPNIGPMPPPNKGAVPPNNTRGVPNNTMYSQHWNGYNWGGMHCNMGGMQTNNMVGTPNWGEVQLNNMGGMLPNNMGGVPANNMGGVPPNVRGVQPNNMGDVPANNMGGVPPNMGGVQPNNMGGVLANNKGGVPPNWGGLQPNNMGSVPTNNGVPNNSPNFQCWNGQNSGGNPYYPGGMQVNNMAGASSWGGVQPNNMWEMQPYDMRGMPNNVPNFQYWNGYNGGGMPYNLSGMQANNIGVPNWRGVPPNNMGGMPPYNGGVPQHNMGGMPNNATNFQYSNGYNSGDMSYQNKEMPGPGKNRKCNTYQAQDMPESDVHPPHQT